MDAGSDDPGGSSRGSSAPELLPKHTIFLSHSGKDKEFVQELNHVLQKAHHSPFFDQNKDSLPIGEKFPELIAKAVEQCLVAVIVLSPTYLQSKWPMKELIACYESMRKGNPIKFVPLFFRLTPDDLKRRTWKDDWRKMFTDDEEQLCIDAVKELKAHNGLQYDKYGNDIIRYREDVLVEICKLLPRAMPFDTSEIQGCDRLCHYISSLFEKNGIQYLGLYGVPGSGKSKICCEAMCNYFNEEFQGRFCVVELENGKAGDSKAAAEKKRLERLKKAIKLLVGLNKNMSTIESESQARKHLTDRVQHQRVFLVVDNVSLSSLEEAEFYVRKAGFAKGSKMLVTSRSEKILQSLLGGRVYCHRLPVLGDIEATQLVLSKAAHSRLNTDLDQDECQILEECIQRCMSDDQYHPSSLKALANYLKSSAQDDILSWREHLDSDSFRGSSESGDIYHFVLLEYDMLDRASKRILVDLAIFAEGMCYTHMDFHPDLGWDEHSNFTNVVTYISQLHGITTSLARTKVNELQRKSFLKESDTEISVPDFYIDFAKWLIDTGDRDREEKQWYVVCHPEEESHGQCNTFADLPDGSSKIERVSLCSVLVDHSDLLKIRQWKNVAFLDLVQVNNLESLDLQGLHSLRVLKVEECENLKEIVCTCNSSSTSGHFCYQNQTPDVPSRCLSNLRVVQLEWLPSLKTASFPPHASKLETLWFFDCSDLACLPDLQFCKKLKRLRLPCGDFTGFQGLSSNTVLTELAFHWDRDTVRNFTEDMAEKLLNDLMNLTNLIILDVVDERAVYEWIPAGIRSINVSRLGRLTFLDLSCATTIEQVEGLEQLCHLTALGLYGCCALNQLPNLAVFRNLKRLCIGHCHKLAQSITMDDMPRGIEEFHPLGDFCNFGEHECLDPDDKEGICKICEPQLWDEINGEQEWDKPNVQRASQRANVEQASQGPNVEQTLHQPNVEQPLQRPNVEQTLQRPNVEQTLQRPNVEQAWQEPKEEKALQRPKEESWAWQEPKIEKAPQEHHMEARSEHGSYSGKTRPSTQYPINLSAKKDSEQAPSAIPAAQRQLLDTSTNNNLNILLLGETGVGKSTFINALCNYLTFPTLDEACNGEMQSLIYSEFMISDAEGKEIKVAVGTPNEDEGASNKNVGSSCTQKCKAYTFPIGQKTFIRLVDTPGIGDTRGFDQDVKNMKDILSFISRYDVLNAICILLKPDEERLTISLKYCIIELLAHLHKDASRNILFCFTNSRRTFFRVGSTKRLLTKLLSESSKTAAIKVDMDTMYHFDSEGFKFLASTKNGLKFSAFETNSFGSSWEMSTDEASRLIKHIASLSPHDIESTLSLNRVRDMLATIEIPLAAISAAIQNNLDENARNVKELLERHGNVAEKYKTLLIKEEVLEMVSIGHLRTICNAPSCKDKICHDDCRPTETVTGGILGYFTADKYVFCEKISLRSNKCRACGCHRDLHVRVAHERRTVVREKEDESVRKVIEETESEIEKRNKIKEVLDQRETSYKDEMDVVVNAAALFAGFLAQNSIFTFNAATEDYLRDQIKRKKHSDDHSTPKGKARIAELEKLLATYENQVQSFKNRSGPSSGRDITTEDVRNELNKLLALPRNGESLKILMDDLEREYKLAGTRVDEVPVNIMPKLAPVNQAEFNRSRGGKSLLEKLADI